MISVKTVGDVLHEVAALLHRWKRDGLKELWVWASRQATSLGLPRTEVAQLPATRAANCGIADLPGLSPRTEPKHTEGVFAKFGVHSRRAQAKPPGGDVGVT